MRNTPLLKWGNNNNKQAGKQGNRNWLHLPDSLQRGHIAYLVRFYGSTEVDQPKGINVVKEGIRKLQFSQQIRKSEGSKPPKVELTISIDGVAVQEAKTKKIMHQYPLHRISYCADDKGEKKFFSFIAKEADSEKHVCFVFVSDKLAEEITLTIGQAFDLAYRRFLETSGKDLEVQRRLVTLTQHSCRLEQEKSALVQRLTDIANLNVAEVKDYMVRQGLTDLASVPVVSTSANTTSATSTPTSSSESSSFYSYDVAFNGSSNFTNSSSSTNSPHTNGDVLLLNLANSSPSSNGTSPSSGAGSSGASLLSSSAALSPANAPPIPPRPYDKKLFGDDFLQNVSPIPQPSVGTKLQGLLLDETDEDFNPRATETVSSNSVQATGAGTSTPVSLNGANGANGATPTPAPLLAPPPSKQSVFRRPQPPMTPVTNGSAVDLFGSSPLFGNANSNGNGSGIAKPIPMQRSASPSKLTNDDPFGMGNFDGMTGADGSQREIENALGFLDKRLLEMKDGFSRGLTFGNEDFSLESLDPLRN